MFKPSKAAGDTIAVPQLVFSRLSGASEARVRVALHALTQPECDAQSVAAALHLPLAEAQQALAYWEGAGLLEQTVQAPLPAPGDAPKRRKHMTTAEVNQEAGTDAALSGMLRELQRALGGVLNPRECNIYCTLYCRDGFSPDLVLTAALHCAATGKATATRVERTLLSWQSEGIHDCEAADVYLKCLEERQRRYEEMAQLYGYKQPNFTGPERKIIDAWFEEYHFGPDMLEAARNAAGDKQNETRYVNVILKKWHAKGYRTAADVRSREGGAGLRSQAGQSSFTAQNDILKNASFVPTKPKGMNP